jgi:hypothetical protein
MVQLSFICSVICGNSSYMYLSGSITFYQHTAKPGDTASKMHAIGRGAGRRARPVARGVVFHGAAALRAGAGDAYPSK